MPRTGGSHPAGRWPRSRRPAARGFTMLEMMVVCAILGAVLLLVPVSFDGFGARARLSTGANTILSKLTASRERATLDGFEARLEIGTYADEQGERHVGTRFWYTNLPAKSTQGNPDQREQQEQRVTSRAQERQWLVSTWQPLPDGVVVSGVSLEAGHWEKIGEGDRTFQVHYFPDGAVDRGVGVRLECLDIDARPEDRSVTILVNALTAEASSYDGFKELPRQRDAHEFH